MGFALVLLVDHSGSRQRALRKDLDDIRPGVGLLAGDRSLRYRGVWWRRPAVTRSKYKSAWPVVVRRQRFNARLLRIRQPRAFRRYGPSSGRRLIRLFKFVRIPAECRLHAGCWNGVDFANFP